MCCMLQGKRTTFNLVDTAFLCPEFGSTFHAAAQKGEQTCTRLEKLITIRNRSDARLLSRSDGGKDWVVHQ